MSDFAMNVGKASNFTWGLQGTLLVTFASPGTIEPERFDEWIAAIRANRIEFVLGAATGANTITGAQRRQVTDVFGGLTRISVVVDNRVTRGIFTALGWLGLNLKCHPWTEIEQAAAYLKVPDVKQSDIVANLWKLRGATEAGRNKPSDSDDHLHAPH
ncbi:hypothetical protein ACNOYE_04585 [Nannocystaceae bacterium ST9]